MHISPEFKLFGLQFIQDIELLGDTLDELLENVLIPFRGDARWRLRVFLNEAVRAGGVRCGTSKALERDAERHLLSRRGELRRMLTAARGRL